MRWKTRKGSACCSAAGQFSRFEDLDDRYDLRPSAWITPKGEWGKGKIELVEIPTNDETNDNIVTYWTPDQLPEPGKEMNFKYTITFSRDEDKAACAG
ncbi:glucans biosynthesis protein G [Klebsiella pneumoniae]|uniref:Glucans biosynthesis protein G n=1 Tax=Klebsiella pneumoniae TaxID=573 RepID=A0A377XR34_KLEPN|nr:glucans biosynthesis protein G [Klebsiella pneumoniae]